MENLADFRPRRRISVEDAARLDAKLNTIVADHPSLRASAEVMRNDIRSQQERPAAWRFVMLEPRINAVILDRILNEAARPKVSIRLWAALLCYLEADTGRVKMTRHEMMEAVGTKSSSVITVALAELVDFGALKRDTIDRKPHWFLNSRIGTHLAEHLRPAAQADELNVLDLARESRKRRQTSTEA